MEKKWWLFSFLAIILIASSILIYIGANYKPIKRLPDGLVVIAFPESPEGSSITASSGEGSDVLSGQTDLPSEDSLDTEKVDLCGDGVCEIDETCSLDCTQAASEETVPNPTSEEAAPNPTSDQETVANTEGTAAQTQQAASGDSEASEEEIDVQTNPEPEEELTEENPTSGFVLACLANHQTAFIRIENSANYQIVESPEDCDIEFSPMEESQSYSYDPRTSLLTRMFKRILGIGV